MYSKIETVSWRKFCSCQRKDFGQNFPSFIFSSQSLVKDNLSIRYYNMASYFSIVMLCVVHMTVQSRNVRGISRRTHPDVSRNPKSLEATELQHYSCLIRPYLKCNFGFRVLPSSYIAMTSAVFSETS